jgi:hypothetical protein
LVLEIAAAPKKFDLYRQISNTDNFGCNTEKNHSEQPKVFFFHSEFLTLQQTKSFRCKQNKLFGFSKGLFTSKLIYVISLAYIFALC